MGPIMHGDCASFLRGGLMITGEGIQKTGMLSSGVMGLKIQLWFSIVSKSELSDYEHVIIAYLGRFHQMLGSI